MSKSNFIENLRKKFNLSQEQLAKELGISRPTYVQIEKGEKDLTIKEARILASIFNMTLEEFINKGEPAKVNIEIRKSDGKEKIKERADIRISIPQENLDKFREAVIYILKKVGWKPNFGMAVFYKILYFIDFDFYEKYEEQIFGATYIKNHYGPTPVMFAKVLTKMKDKNEIEEIRSKFFKYDQTKYIVNPEREPDLRNFTAQEIKHIDDELERLSDMTASDLKKYSHKDIPWLTAEEGKPLDYESVFYRTDETSAREYDDKN
ncbi:MAG: type II toxin-antitoxin system antitoxin SocA domain-containing protein [Candidatus Falkowbacteria bacterium]